MKKRIRVYEIVFSFDIESGGGGISRFATTLSKSLDPERFEPILCGLWDRGSEEEKQRIQQLNENGIYTFTCTHWDEQHPYRSFARAYLGLRTALKRLPADILNSHSEFSDMAVLLLKLAGKAPVLVRTLHNELRVVWRRRPLRRLLFTQILDPLLFDAEIGVSRFIKENLDRRWLAKRLKRKARAINNALDIHRFRGETVDMEAIRRELGIPEDAYVIGSVGRLCEQKGFDLLVDAAAEVVKATPEAWFLIVGDGDAAETLKQQAASLGIGRRVIFTGQRSDVEALLTAMDLFVCSSRWEGLSTVLMEAMAAGVPIVATDIPGNRELLRDGDNAWLIPVENPRALAAAVLAARGNIELGRRYAHQAGLDVLDFGITQVAAQYGHLYQELMPKKGG